jgi:hypothetical protein
MRFMIYLSALARCLSSTDQVAVALCKQLCQLLMEKLPSVFLVQLQNTGAFLEQLRRPMIIMIMKKRTEDNQFIIEQMSLKSLHAAAESQDNSLCGVSATSGS